MTDDADANRFEAALEGVLKAFPAKDLVEQLELLYGDAKFVFEICSRQLDFLKVGARLPSVIDRDLRELVSDLHSIRSGSTLYAFYLAARGLKSEWLHYPSGKTLLVHSAAVHVAETLLQFPDLASTARVDWSVAALADPGWLIDELRCEYIAAISSLETRRPSKCPPRMPGERRLWTFGGSLPDSLITTTTEEKLPRGEFTEEDRPSGDWATILDVSGQTFRNRMTRSAKGPTWRISEVAPQRYVIHLDDLPSELRSKRLRDDKLNR
jgi:hypothetical protein